MLAERRQHFCPCQELAGHGGFAPCRRFCITQNLPCCCSVVNGKSVVRQAAQNNGSVYLHAYFAPTGLPLDPDDPFYDARVVFHQTSSARRCSFVSAVWSGNASACAKFISVAATCGMSPRGSKAFGPFQTYPPSVMVHCLPRMHSKMGVDIFPTVGEQHTK